MSSIRRRHAAASLDTPAVGGRHELGQNFLVDRGVCTRIAEVVSSTTAHPVLELGAGDGAITRALVAANLPVTALELDPRRVRRLQRTFADGVTVVHGDMLRYDFGPYPHHVVSTVPFSITTPLLRRLIGQRFWHTAVLLVQWEVARKRAGVGGTTMLTAASWPWYEFTLVERVPKTSFDPVPSVDGGILVIERRSAPLLDDRCVGDYQNLVREVYTGPGRGLAAILRTRLPGREVDAWLRRERVDPAALPRDLKAGHWASLYRLYREVGTRPAPAGRSVRARPGSVGPDRSLPPRGLRSGPPRARRRGGGA
uniref:Mycinamicin-resistance protein MyrB n=2 Tax=Micromonospora griseorubida TaxID=28040 RepID=MYRB_MICGR|nr:23S rRNA (adenine(2058)-N(6))-methyltransferase Erm(W) [Micromonospora griseorubida]P43433.1 RecName: Full=Mycinamicin-resistance protein MyrB [Micromonospora griseorubida]BAA03402.1 myrB [Micromonospora griseorubida]